MSRLWLSGTRDSIDRMCLTNFKVSRLQSSAKVRGLVTVAAKSRLKREIFDTPARAGFRLTFLGFSVFPRSKSFWPCDYFEQSLLYSPAQYSPNVYCIRGHSIRRMSTEEWEPALKLQFYTLRSTSPLLPLNARPEYIHGNGLLDPVLIERKPYDFLKVV